MAHQAIALRVPAAPEKPWLADACPSPVCQSALDQRECDGTAGCSVSHHCASVDKDQIQKVVVPLS